MAKNLLANKKKGKKRRASSSSDRERSSTPDEAGLEDQLALQLGIKARAKKLKACCRYDLGDAHCGGGSGAVQELLKNVQPTASLLLLCVVTGLSSPVVILTVVVTVVLCRVSCESRSRSRAPGGVAESSEVSVQ